METLLFRSGSVPTLSRLDYSAELPPQLTCDVYLSIARQIWATLRFEFYPKLVMSRNQNVEIINDDEIEKLHEQMKTCLETNQEQIYEQTIGTQSNRPKEAKIMMLKAFLTYASET